MDNSAKISVIIPVFNVSNYLAECLDSVVKQTYPNLQILLVDDGSTDGSGIICDAYADRDNRIRVHHQRNQGVSIARNVALDLADGQYVSFVDADDILPAFAYQEMLQSISEAQLLMCRFERIDANGKTIADSEYLPQTSMKGQEMLWYLFDEEKYGYQGYLWNKLYDLSIIQKNHLRFDPEISLNEDRLFLTEYLCHCNSVSFSNVMSYQYRQREDSAIGVTKKKVTAEEITVTKSFEKIKSLVYQKYPNVYYLVCRRAFECGLALLKKVPRDELQIKKYLKHVMWSNALLCLHTPGIGIKEQAKMIGHCLLKR